MIKKISVKFKKLHPDARTPTMSTQNAAGFDLYAIEDKIISPHETFAVKTGIAVQIPVGKVLHIWDRSGMGVKGLSIHGGVIDSDYRGEINAVLCNHNNYPIEIKKYDRVCQGVIIDYYSPELEEAMELEDSERGERWNSSTGR